MSAGRLVLLGAYGSVGRRVAELLAAGEPDVELVLAGRDGRRLDELSEALGAAAVTATVDVLDRGALADTVRGADLVVNATGPFYRTAPPAMEACLAAGADYLDLDDDVESTRRAAELADRAADRGIRLFKCCGSAPGLDNVMARELAERLDELELLEFGICIGDEGGPPVSLAGLDHLLHASLAPDGGEPLARSATFPMAPPLGEVTAYEVHHAEAVSIRSLAREAEVRCYAYIDPAPFNDIWRGIARAAGAGDLDYETALRFAHDLAEDHTGSLAGWRHALPALLGHPWRPEGSTGELLSFLWHGLRKAHPDYRGGRAVRAVGRSGGERVTLLRRTVRWGPDTPWRREADATGRPAAAFAALALANGAEPGVLFPQDWCEPATLYRRIELQGDGPAVEGDVLTGDREPAFAGR